MKSTCVKNDPSLALRCSNTHSDINPQLLVSVGEGPVLLGEPFQKEAFYFDVSHHLCNYIQVIVTGE